MTPSRSGAPSNTTPSGGGGGGGGSGTYNSGRTEYGTVGDSRVGGPSPHARGNNSMVDGGGDNWQGGQGPQRDNR